MYSVTQGTLTCTPSVSAQIWRDKQHSCLCTCSKIPSEKTFGDGNSINSVWYGVASRREEGIGLCRLSPVWVLCRLRRRWWRRLATTCSHPGSVCVSLWLVLVKLTCFLLRSLALNITCVVNFKCSFYTSLYRTCYNYDLLHIIMKGKGDGLVWGITGRLLVLWKLNVLCRIIIMGIIQGISLICLKYFIYTV